MLDVTFYRDGSNRLSSVHAAGHTDFAAAGQDVVCAAASAILQAVSLGLAAHARLDLNVVQRSGEFRLGWPQKARGDPAVEAIVATAELSIVALAEQFPAHVRVRRARMR